MFGFISIRATVGCALGFMRRHLNMFPTTQKPFGPNHLESSHLQPILLESSHLQHLYAILLEASHLHPILLESIHLQPILLEANHLQHLLRHLRVPPLIQLQPSVHQPWRTQQTKHTWRWKQPCGRNEKEKRQKNR